MTRKLSFCLIIALLLQSLTVFGVMGVSAEEAEEEHNRSEQARIDLAPDAESAVLMDMDTGKILYEKNSDTPLPPASITKIMSMLLIMEAIDEGKVNWNDKVRTSERAASMGGSQIFLEVGEEMTVEDLMKGVAIASGNDATVALAEHIAGTEENFIQMMNDRAQELGMENTHFVNTNGLPAPGHETTARDIAVMSRELMKHEEITRFTGVYEDYLREESDKPFWLVNTNRLVKFYDGMDGLKTGYTSEAQYCLAATAKRGDMRLIAVVMGAPSPKKRNEHITSMMDYAFSQYETHPIHKEGDVVGKVKVDKGAQTEAELVVPHQISVLTEKGKSTDQFVTTVEPHPNLTAPINQGDLLGSVKIEKDGQVETEVQIVATEDIPRASFWQLSKRILTSLFGILP